MPKFARLVVPDWPHHIIQRGNRRQRVFFDDSDWDLYLKLIKSHAERAGISFVAYCLLNNHVHLIGVPKTPQSLARGIGEAHRKYTNIINIREGWKGYLWQGRFISFPMDERHLYVAIRYVERNPVRAGIVKEAEDYPWSSARAHVDKTDDILVSGGRNPLGIEDWKAYLKEIDDADFIEQMKRCEKNGRPLGDNDYLRRLEVITGRKILPRTPGRKKGNGDCVSQFKS